MPSHTAIAQAPSPLRTSLPGNDQCTLSPYKTPYILSPSSPMSQSFACNGETNYTDGRYATFSRKDSTFGIGRRSVFSRRTLLSPTSTAAEPQQQEQEAVVISSQRQPSSTRSLSLPSSFHARHDVVDDDVGSMTETRTAASLSLDSIAAISDFLSPTPTSKWQRGSAAVIEWSTDDVRFSEHEHVKIELLRRGSRATTIVTRRTPNTGRYVYSRVPWGMLIGGGYYIRISSADEESIFHDSHIFEISR